MWWGGEGCFLYLISLFILVNGIVNTSFIEAKDLNKVMLSALGSLVFALCFGISCAVLFFSIVLMIFDVGSYDTGHLRPGTCR